MPSFYLLFVGQNAERDLVHMSFLDLCICKSIIEAYGERATPTDWNLQPAAATGA